MPHQTLEHADRTILSAVINGEISPSYAERWVITHNVSGEKLKLSYINNRGNREIIDAMTGHQDASNPAFVALTQ